MFLRLALTIACLMVLPQAAGARQITLECEVIFDPSGSQRLHLVTVDTEQKVVHDDDLTWVDGAANPASANLEEWAQVQDGVVSWGNRHTGPGAATSVFELNLQTGHYTLTSAANGRVSHGFCRNRALTS